MNCFYEPTNTASILERRSDMITLTNDLDTPQIFFNKLHIGGLNELQHLFDIYIQEEEELPQQIQEQQEKEEERAEDNQTEHEQQDNDNDDDDDDNNSNHSNKSNKSNNNVSDILLQRITKSVLQQPDPATHEPKLRVPCTPSFSPEVLVSNWNDSSHSDLFQFSLRSMKTATTTESMKNSDLFYKPFSLSSINEIDYDHYDYDDDKGTMNHNYNYPNQQQQQQHRHPDAQHKSWLERMHAHDTFHFPPTPTAATTAATTATTTSSLQAFSISNVTSNLAEKIHHKTKFHSLKLYTNCCRGNDVMTILQEEYSSLLSSSLSSSEQNILAFGQKLLDLGILHDCTFNNDNLDNNRKKSTFRKQGYYQVQTFHQPFVLNKHHCHRLHLSKNSVDPQPLKTLNYCMNLLQDSIRANTTTTTSTATSSPTITRSSSSSYTLFPASHSNITNTTAKMTSIDYKGILKSISFQTFQEQICLLQLIDVDDFIYMDENVKLVYFVNLHNVMMMHAIILFQGNNDDNKDLHHSKKQHNKIQNSHHRYHHHKYKKKWMSFCSKLKYLIGGSTLTLDEIYHGILRCNTKHPKTGKVVFAQNGDDDDRKKFICSSTNPRIHFALLYNYYYHAGPTSSHGSTTATMQPSSFYLNLTNMYQFHPEAIQCELYIIAQSSCQYDSRICIDEVNHTLYLPVFLQPFMNDLLDQEQFWNYNGENHDYARIMTKYLVGDQRELLRYLLQKETSKQTMGPVNVVFDKRDRRKVKTIQGFKQCLPSLSTCVGGTGSGSDSNCFGNKRLRVGGNKHRGTFTSAFEDSELKLGLLNEHAPLEASIEDNARSGFEFNPFSLSTSIQHDNFLFGNSFETASTASSCNLKLKVGWDEFNDSSRDGTRCNKDYIYCEDDDDGYAWETFGSCTFEEAPFTPAHRKMDSINSPSNTTVRTASTTNASPSSHSFDDDFTSTPNRIAKELEFPEFTFDENELDFSIIEDYCNDHDDGLSFGDSTTCTDGPPQARRVEHDNLFKSGGESQKDGRDKSSIITADIISIFFPPGDTVQTIGEENNESQFNSDSNDDDDDDFSCLSENNEQESLGSSLLSRDTHFDKLFHSSIASI